MIDEFVETVPIGIDVLDRPGRDSGFHGRLGNRRRDLADQARVEWIRNQVFGTEVADLLTVGLGCHLGLLDARQFGNRLDGGQLHRFRDRARPDVERAAENEGETQHIVDLVGVVGATGSDDRIATHRLDLFRSDFRVGVGERHDQWPGRHPGNHLRLENASGRQAEEDVGALDDFTQGARVGLLGVAPLDLIHLLDPPRVDQPLDVGHPDVLDRDTEHDQQVKAGERGSAGTRGDHLHLIEFLALQEQTIEDRGSDDDRRPVLVVMKHRNLHPFAQLPLDVEALRCLDVLEVDTTKRRLQRGNDLHQTLRIPFLDLEVEDVDIREFLEQDRLAFHHRLRRQRTDRAKAEDSCAIGDDADQIGARRQRTDLRGNGDDLLTGRGDAGRVGHGKIVLVGELRGRLQ